MMRTDSQNAEVAPPAPKHANTAWQFSELPTSARHLRAGHVVISSFDGVHIGHRALLARAADKAAAQGGHVVAILFDDPSGDAVHPLADRAETVRRLREAGAEVLLLEFDRYASWLELQTLCDLVRECEPKSVTISAQFRFGHDGHGCADQLAARVREHGVPVEVVAPVTAAHDPGPVSAEKVRSYLAIGQVSAANALLGRCWSIEGPVVHGFKRGRELGFPTANVQPGRVLPLAYGIYAVRASFEGRVLDGVASYGTRPQFDNGAPLLEVHILDFSGDIYGATVRVEFVSHQRAELVFDSVDALTRQMEIDRADARDLLRRVDRNLLAAAAV